MKSRLTLRLPAALADKLERSSKRMKRNRSDLARLFLNQFLGATLAAAHPVDLVRGLIGSVKSGVPDLGQRHREHLIARLRHTR